MEKIVYLICYAVCHSWSWLTFLNTGFNLHLLHIQWRSQGIHGTFFFLSFLLQQRLQELHSLRTVASCQELKLTQLSVVASCFFCWLVLTLGMEVRWHTHTQRHSTLLRTCVFETFDQSSECSFLSLSQTMISSYHGWQLTAVHDL